MTVDLSKAIKGSTVHFRCGGSAVVQDILSRSNGVCDISFKEGWHIGFYTNGMFYEGKKYPLDIIRVDPPAFNWDDVRPGMAFRLDHDNRIGVFVGRSIQDRNYMVLDFPENYGGYHFMALRRAPDHDIEVEG